MRGKGEPTVDMGGKEDALTRPRLRLYLVPRQPQSPDSCQARGGQIFQILWPKRRLDPVSLNPTRRQLGFIFLPFAVVVAFFVRSSAAVLSFTMVAGNALAER